MELPGTDTTLVLDRPSVGHGRHRSEGRGRSTPGTREEGSGGPVAAVPGDGATDLGSLLRAPGLAVLAALFLVEGYRWLGIVHGGTTGLGSLLFGTAGLAVVAVLAPVMTAYLGRGRRTNAWVSVEDVVIVVAVAVTVTTSTALVVGGSVWRDVAGTTDLLLAATALGTVVLGERDRRRSLSATAAQMSAVG